MEVAAASLVSPITVNFMLEGLLLGACSCVLVPVVRDLPLAHCILRRQTSSNQYKLSFGVPMAL